ncbi:MAG: nuclear transport factor 2 family protein [Chitinophagaceae bacterium]|nr:nuclear transport factor 2 family protein [Chitinophagaceae bacterium]
MKKMIIIAAICFQPLYLLAQTAEDSLRILEQQEVQAILAKDTATLLELWDKEYTVNSPDNVIYFAGKTTLDRPVLKRNRTTFVRVIEHITIKGNFAFCMGNETVVPAGDSPQTGEVVKRRFTNIWEKQATGWKLVGRHANIICR